MRIRVRKEHWNIILDMCEKNPTIITNRFIGAGGRQERIAVWQKLSKQLNGLGFGKKPADRWRKTLMDWKFKTKVKAAKLGETGNGPRLSKLEQRLLSLMERTSMENELKEMGFGGQIMMNPSFSGENLTLIVHDDDEDDADYDYSELSQSPTVNGFFDENDEMEEKAVVQYSHIPESSVLDDDSELSASPSIKKSTGSKKTKIQTVEELFDDEESKALVQYKHIPATSVQDDDSEPSASPIIKKSNSRKRARNPNLDNFFYDKESKAVVQYSHIPTTSVKDVDSESSASPNIRRSTSRKKAKKQTVNAFFDEKESKALVQYKHIPASSVKDDDSEASPSPSTKKPTGPKRAKKSSIDHDYHKPTLRSASVKIEEPEVKPKLKARPTPKVRPRLKARVPNRLTMRTLQTLKNIDKNIAAIAESLETIATVMIDRMQSI